MRELRCATLLFAGLLSLGCGSETPAGEANGAGGGSATGGAAGSVASGGVGAGGAGGVGGAPAMAGAAPFGTDLGTLSVEGVATWRGATQGAYTIIHDDLCDFSIDSLFDVAEPELTARKLPAAFGAIVSRCEERELWSKLTSMIDSGHEIINHSWDHQDIGLGASLETQLNQATTTLDANLVGQKTGFFIFPYDSFSDAAVTRLGELGYLGARAGTKGVNVADFPDGLRVKFDVYGGENSIYDGQGDILKIYVDLAIAEGGWSVREFHGIADTSFWAIEVEAYRAHLDYVRLKVDAGELWVDTPSTVVRYRFARQHCGLPTVSGATLMFGAAGAKCIAYATPLSVLVTTERDAPSLIAVQDGGMVKTRRLAVGRYVVDINPLGGAVTTGGGD